MDLGLAWIVLAGVIGFVIVASGAKHLSGDVHWLREAPTYNMVVRSFVTITFIGAYAFGFIVIQGVRVVGHLYHDQVEGFGLVLALVGGYVERIIDKLYADQA